MNLKIDHIMTKKLLTIKTTEGLEAAYLKMKLNGIRHLPVLDATDHVVGILSDRDVQRAMMSFDSGEFDFSPDDVVEDYMSADLKTVAHDGELIQVVKMMLTHQISAVLITKKEYLVGIITHEDLLLILSDLLQPKTDVVETVQSWIYNTPVSAIAEKFATAGI